ncbi:hypothetical protein I3760_14G110100 [Carya illinoinensis]|nr:hypothetical protein I3760_14G110100 [Carya illinoinensis]
MLLILLPCSGLIFNQLNHFVKWLCRSLGATFFCIIRHQEEPELHQPQVGIRVTEVENLKGCIMFWKELKPTH